MGEFGLETGRAESHTIHEEQRRGGAGTAQRGEGREEGRTFRACDAENLIK